MVLCDEELVGVDDGEGFGVAEVGTDHFVR
jgi:hypothetical protein